MNTSNLCHYQTTDLPNSWLSSAHGPFLLGTRLQPGDRLPSTFSINRLSAVGLSAITVIWDYFSNGWADGGLLGVSEVGIPESSGKGLPSLDCQCLINATRLREADGRGL
jgi:hypothetical protein